MMLQAERSSAASSYDRRDKPTTQLPPTIKSRALHFRRANSILSRDSSVKGDANRTSHTTHNDPIILPNSPPGSTDSCPPSCGLIAPLPHNHHITRYLLRRETIPHHLPPQLPPRIPHSCCRLRCRAEAAIL
ncbi:hypothetical protein ACN42_g10436 [Penicillium freii]|uniref:Uncharacterized protein n=1 Tax=Penicillium freii TaxID=48697 RepID=A0A117NKW4_PENFR|nr:hypothetical protein ACN42_g10436 [Penicillium freii]